MNEHIAKILSEFEFLSYGTMQDISCLGIIQNSDNQLVSMYAYDAIPDEVLRKEFIECGLIWWWESNRQLPINIFIGSRFKPFRPYLKHFSSKDFILHAGPSVSLQETISRRVRKRQVMLVRRPDSIDPTS